MFSKQERSSFKYWFAHFCAFNMTALNLKAWKPKYLLHDAEKPWLKLLWGDYKKVQKWHRSHNKHHVEWMLKHKTADFEAMAIDWECSRFTKEAQQLNAMQELVRKYNSLIEDGNRKDAWLLYTNMKRALTRLNLWNDDEDPMPKV